MVTCDIVVGTDAKRIVVARVTFEKMPRVGEMVSRPQGYQTVINVLHVPAEGDTPPKTVLFLDNW